jgi:hypothetical protein
MKSPPQQFTDDEARRRMEAFIRDKEEIATTTTNPNTTPALA